jgi:hypothetical protein
VSERESTWKAAVDGVVSDVDVLTRHLRRRQQQTLRLAWSAVGGTALVVGALIALNLPPASPGAPLGQPPAIALLDPTAPEPVLNEDGGTRLLPGIETAPSPPAATAPLNDATATLASAPRRTAAIPPAAPPGPVASTSMVTVIPPPAAEAPDSSPPAPQSLVDALVTGVVHLLS